MRKTLRIWPALIGCAAIAACSSAPKPSDRLVPDAPPTPLACADFSFPIYFEKASDKLTDPARSVLAAGAQRAKGCKVSKIEVLGLADADGPANRNLALSRRRAAVVVKALEGTGLPAPVFDIEAIGEAGAKAETLRRRTEVIIHAAQ